MLFDVVIAGEAGQRRRPEVVLDLEERAFELDQRGVVGRVVRVAPAPERRVVGNAGLVACEAGAGAVELRWTVVVAGAGAGVVRQEAARGLARHALRIALAI